MKRRSFLIAPAAVAAALAPGAGAGAACARSGNAVAAAGEALPPAARVLAAMLSDCDAAASIGRRCLAQGLVPAQTAACLRLAGVGDADGERAPGCFRNRCASDYAAGRTVSVDGWVLSFAEAGLFASLALISGDGDAG
jgi:hypothetical protein